MNGSPNIMRWGFRIDSGDGAEKIADSVIITGEILVIVEEDNDARVFVVVIEDCSDGMLAH